jgi:outer membrane lipoprotein-sorting protein
MKDDPMKLFLKKLLLVSFTLTPLSMIQPIVAAVEQSSQDQIKKIQSYLNGIRTLRANFSQDNPNGSTASGKMYLKRLGRESFGKLRLEYAPPALIKIIADGEILRHEDGDTKEISEYSIDSTPASFLLRHKIDFFDDLEVKKMETKGNKIYLTVSRPGDEGVMLTLIFVTSPMLRLQEWTVIDGQANETHVVLTEVEIGVPLDEKLFKF